MRIIVNDANILIDLVDLKILPHFFQLKYEFHTTEMILDELFPEQKEALVPYIETGSLIIDEITEDDLVAILHPYFKTKSFRTGLFCLLSGAERKYSPYHKR